MCLQISWNVRILANKKAKMEAQLSLKLPVKSEGGEVSFSQIKVEREGDNCHEDPTNNRPLHVDPSVVVKVEAGSFESSEDDETYSSEVDQVDREEDPLNCNEECRNKVKGERSVDLQTFSANGLCEQFCLEGNLCNYPGAQKEKERFACDVCGKFFFYKCRLTEHMKVHTRVKPFACGVCGKAFSQKESLLEHMRSHTGEKPYICCHCGSSFARKRLFIHHKRVHSRETLFTCKVCGREFPEDRRLIRHMRIHTGEKPFTCSECGRKFALQHTLKDHMKTHTGERPYTCAICGRSFAQKSNMNSHMRTHTGEKPFPCRLCGEKFWKRIAVEKHLKKIHGNLFSTEVR